MSSDPQCAGATVYYDGACPLCRREIGLYRTSDGADNLAFVDVSHPDATLPAGLTREAAMARFHVADASGQTLSGAAAFAALWLQLPRWRWLGHVVRLPVVRGIAERAYRLFLTIRPQFQKLARRLDGPV